MPAGHTDEPQNGGSRPVPDPTVLTTNAVNAAMAQIRRDMHAEREHADAEFAARDERLRAIDEATTLRLQRLDHIPGQIDEKVSKLDAVVDERFRSLDSKFADIATRTAEQKSDTKGAVDAALQAAKEAVTAQTEASEKSITKSETATTERIKAVEQTATVSKAAADQQLNDLKERIVSLESTLRGDVTATARVHQESTRTSGLIFAAVGAFIGVAGLVAGIAASLGR